MKKLYEPLRKILLSEWDPLNTEGYGPSDEYDAYLPRILRLVTSKDISEEILYNCFKEIEDGKIGLSISDEKRWIVVRKILALVSQETS